jgi:hypothetical protein
MVSCTTVQAGLDTELAGKINAAAVCVAGAGTGAVWGDGDGRTGRRAAETPRASQRQPAGIRGGVRCKAVWHLHARWRVIDEHTYRA